MFKDTKLTSLDLSNFDTTNVTDMNGMFSGLKLQHLTLGDNFKFIGINSDLDIPYFSNGAAGGRWKRADGQSSAYSPADFIKNYGTGELTAGEYVGAQRIFGDAYYTYNEAEHKLNITGGSITNRSDWGNISRADIKSIEFSSPIAVTVTSLSSWLSNLTQLESITGFQNLDTSKVLSMNNMFSKDAALQTLDLSGLNTYNVVSMDYMFADMPSLTSLNLSGFDTKNLRSMAYMFKGLKLQHLILGDYFRFKGEDSKLGVPYSLQGLPGERWRRADGQSSEYSPADFIKNYGTGELTAGEYVAGQRIFGGATYTYDELDGKLVITGGSISNASDWGNIDRTAIKSIEFNTPIPVKTTSLTQWFAFCENLESIVGLSNLNTSGVTEMNGMFMELSKMKTLDLSNFDTSSVISMAQMFANSSIIQLNISGFDANITEMNGMFKGLKLQRLILGEHFKFSGENCELGVPYFTNGNAGLKWRRADGKSSEYSPADFIKNYGTGDLTAGEYVAEKRIFGEASYTYNELEGKLVITGGAISNASDWGNIDRSTIKSIEFNTPIPVTTSSLSGWLSNLTQLESITGLNNLDTSKVTNMKRMFFKDTSLKSLNMSGIDTSNVTDMSSMFSDLTNLTSLDVSNMNTSNVTQMQYMFSYNTALTNLNLSSFDTSNVTDMSYMFYNLRSLRKIDISNFNTINVKNMSHMFLHVHMTHLTLGNKFEFKYDLSNDPSLSVPFLMNGKAAQKWTREDGQSEGYPPVEFMKAYDTGTLTSGTYIAEDKAPQADPVIQIIQLGEKLPDNPRDVLENIVDEDINSLSVSYTKVPDTPKIGYYTAEVELKDSSDQKTLIPISVNVIDKNTTASNLNDFFPVAIHAEDFTIYSDEIEKYINDMQGLNKFIIEKSNAWGWTLEKGDDAIVTVADNGLGQIQIESKPGQYELEIRSSLTNSAMNKITVTVIDSKEQLDVTVPINTEFVSLDTDGGEIKSPMYHITNNSPKDIEVGVNNVEITNNNDNLSLLASSSPDPSSGNNAAKLKLSLESEGKTKVFDLFPGNLAEGLVKASPQEVTDFQIGGKYFGDFEKEKQLGLNVVYSFKIISK
ncbi:BspA family leucine-rich repeat surface protein [Lactococcus garvieae]|uniref:BspA family leucine-rich repeat surface protein n=1 Tax=Lactococcus garvieae TaxID=1363 RepID=UPI00385256F8